MHLHLKLKKLQVRLLLLLRLAHRSFLRSWKRNARRRSNGTIEFCSRRCRRSCERPAESTIETITKGKGFSTSKNSRRTCREIFPFFSLNHEKRRRELLRVSKENATMSKRIQNRKAEMSRDAWKRDSSKNNGYLFNISKYGPNWFLPKVR